MSALLQYFLLKNLDGQRVRLHSGPVLLITVANSPHESGLLAWTHSETALPQALADFKMCLKQ